MTSINLYMLYRLIYDMVASSGGGGRGEEAGDVAGFENCLAKFPAGLFDSGRGGRPGLPAGWESLSGMGVASIM